MAGISPPPPPPNRFMTLRRTWFIVTGGWLYSVVWGELVEEWVGGGAGRVENIQQGSSPSLSVSFPTYLSTYLYHLSAFLSTRWCEQAGGRRGGESGLGRKVNWPMGATSRPGRGQWRAWPARLKAKCANESASHCCLIDSLAQGCSRYICMYVLTL